MIIDKAADRSGCFVGLERFTISVIHSAKAGKTPRIEARPLHPGHWTRALCRQVIEHPIGCLNHRLRKRLRFRTT